MTLLSRACVSPYRIRRSIDTDSAATLVHAFIASRVDYCNTVLAGSPKTITDRIQRVLNAAARVVSGTRVAGVATPPLAWRAYGEPVIG